MVSYQELGACITFITAYVTLCAMHILAATLGWGVAFVIPEFWTKLICTILFIVIAIGMFIMAFYDRHPEDTNKMLGKTGHSVTVTVKEKVHDNQNEGGSDSDSDEKKSGSGSDKDSDSDHSGSGSSSHDSDSKSDHSDKKSSHKSSSSDDDESDSESDEEE